MANVSLSDIGWKNGKINNQKEDKPPSQVSLSGVASLPPHVLPLVRFCPRSGGTPPKPKFDQWEARRLCPHFCLAWRLISEADFGLALGAQLALCSHSPSR